MFIFFCGAVFWRGMWRRLGALYQALASGRVPVKRGWGMEMKIGKVLGLAMISAGLAMAVVMGWKLWHQFRLESAMAPILVEVGQRVLEVDAQIKGDVTVGEMSRLLERRILDVRDRRLALVALDARANPLLRTTAVEYVDACLGYMRGAQERLSASARKAGAVEATRRYIRAMAGNPYGDVPAALSEVDAAEAAEASALSGLVNRKADLARRAGLARRQLSDVGILTAAQISALDPAAPERPVSLAN